MDAKTRERYEAWKWNRIKRRVIFPGIGLSFALIILMLMLVLGSRSERSEMADAVEVPESTLMAMEPIVYVSNTHPLEMIESTHDDLSSGEMSIVELSHVLAGYLESHGISTLVEDRHVDDQLNQNNWEFDRSYDVARSFVLDARERHSSLAFFIDLHRDSIPHAYATAEINGKSYAQVLFVIGTDNPMGYEASHAVASQLHQMLETKRPGISRGIFLSGGSGRDGVYNQDLSSMVQLVEIGTVESTKEEVSHTVEVLAEVLAEYVSQPLDGNDAINQS